MKGNTILKITGKVTTNRVLPNGAMEVSFTGQGQLAGIDSREKGTYTATLVGGFLHSIGQGVSILANGDNVIWYGCGVGKPLGEDLQASFRFGVTFSTNSKKLAWLNGIFCVGEWHIDEKNIFHGIGWEWS